MKLRVLKSPEAQICVFVCVCQRETSLISFIIRRCAVFVQIKRFLSHLSEEPANASYKSQTESVAFIYSAICYLYGCETKNKSCAILRFNMFLFCF